MTMLLCTDCLHADDRKVDHCPSCGGQSLAKLTSNGDVTTVPDDAGMPCAHCHQIERELKLRYYRRVLGMLIVDQTWGTVGYFCGPCRRRQFASNMAFTLVLGWWGIFAMLFRNPFAVATNLWALFAAPMGADRFGAINVNDIRAGAADEQEHDQRLSDVYMRMPGWMESLTEEDFAQILVDVDYYEVLDVDPGAAHGEIRTAWRTQVKAHHPDRAGDAGHNATILLNDAWAVLGDERLRHAYDHRDEAIAFLNDLDDIDDSADDDTDQEVDAPFACRRCGAGFDSFDDAADHVDREHPHTDYADAIFSLDDDDAKPISSQWACTFCDERFQDYEVALMHADRAHPERTVIDPRNALEVL
jgi:hypothetical protein